MQKNSINNKKNKFNEDENENTNKPKTARINNQDFYFSEYLKQIENKNYFLALDNINKCIQINPNFSKNIEIREEIFTKYCVLKECVSHYTNLIENYSSSTDIESNLELAFYYLNRFDSFNHFKRISLFKYQTFFFKKIDLLLMMN